MSDIHDVKLLVETAKGTLVRTPARFEYAGGRIWFLKSPFALKDEIKAMTGSRWHGFEQENPRKIWSVADNFRNRFQLHYLMGENVYAEPHLPTGYWFGLDLDAFEFWVLEGMDGKPTDWFELEQAGHPKAMAKYVDIACNLVAQRRRTSFKCSALTGT